MIKALFISTIFLLPFASISQKYSFVSYSTEQGLPQSQVTAINQDSDGYLWVGTLGGVAKFGGGKFITYSSDEGLLNNRISSLEFIDNTLWIGHDGGISYIKNGDVKAIAFKGSGNDQSRKVSKIIQFNNDLLVCSNGGGLFVLKDESLKPIPLSSPDYERIRAAYIYKDKLYLATRGGILYTSDGRSFKLVKEYGDNSYSGITGKDNVMVISSYHHGVFIKNMKSQRTRHFTGEELKHSIYGCYIDKSKNIWLNSMDGVVLIDQKKELRFFDDTKGLPVNMIGCFFDDNDGNLWIGSQGKGIFRFPGENFKYYDQTTGFPTDIFFTGFQDKRGNYYYGTIDKGILKKSNSGNVEILPGSQRTIWASLKNLDNKHWFGTGRSLVEVDNNDHIKVHTYDENENIPGTKITALYRISGNSMYVGGNGGVALYKNGVFTKLGKKADRDIGTVRDFEVVDDSLYCATNLGLLVYRDDEFQLVKGAEQVVYNLEKDEFGALWYGTEEGLYRMVKGEIERVELLSDPGSNFIDFMNHRNGELFIGTNNGLFVVSNLDAKDRKIVRYGIGEGIIDLETNLNSGFFDNEGNFWFGTSSGLVCYHIEKSPRVISLPKISLTGILLNYESFDYSQYSNQLNESGFPKDLVLPYAKNNLIFELDGISLVHHKGLNYQFWLEGLRDDWSSLTENPTITFTSLPAGEYVLHVRSVDIDGRMSKEIHFPFIINEAFYKTWWFITLSLLGVGILVFLIFRFRIRRLGELNEKEKLGYKSKLLSLEQKSMNASMNRHFIFNSLNSIQYFINTQDKVSANKYLTNFAKLIRKNLDSVTAEGNVITLEEELERLELYLSLESMRFKDRFEYKIDTGNVDVESILIPPMMMQPFIENSIIHGILPNDNQLGRIEIKVDIAGEFLVISIEDNGIGIQKSISQKMNLDGDHRSQGMEITSKRIELLQKLANKEISLIGPDEIVGNDGSINGTRVLIKIPLSNLEL